jgi:hypothetical protein
MRPEACGEGTALVPDGVMEALEKQIKIAVACHFPSHEVLSPSPFPLCFSPWCEVDIMVWGENGGTLAPTQRETKQAGWGLGGRAGPETGRARDSQLGPASPHL